VPSSTGGGDHRLGQRGETEDAVLGQGAPGFAVRQPGGAVVDEPAVARDQDDSAHDPLFGDRAVDCLVQAFAQRTVRRFSSGELWWVCRRKRRRQHQRCYQSGQQPCRLTSMPAWPWHVSFLHLARSLEETK
jgi:hypothetical protein